MPSEMPDPGAPNEEPKTNTPDSSHVETAQEAVPDPEASIENDGLRHVVDREFDPNDQAKILENLTDATDWIKAISDENTQPEAKILTVKDYYCVLHYLECVAAYLQSHQESALSAHSREQLRSLTVLFDTAEAEDIDYFEAEEKAGRVAGREIYSSATIPPNGEQQVIGFYRTPPEGAEDITTLQSHLDQAPEIRTKLSRMFQYVDGFNSYLQYLYDSGYKQRFAAVDSTNAAIQLHALFPNEAQMLGIAPETPTSDIQSTTANIPETQPEPDCTNVTPIKKPSEPNHDNISHQKIA
jgi:hypothetical protein